MFCAVIRAGKAPGIKYRRIRLNLYGSGNFVQKDNHAPLTPVWRRWFYLRKTTSRSYLKPTQETGIRPIHAGLMTAKNRLLKNGGE